LLIVKVVAQKHLQTKKPKTCKGGFGEANQYDNMEFAFELAASLLKQPFVFSVAFRTRLD